MRGLEFFLPRILLADGAGGLSDEPTVQRVFVRARQSIVEAEERLQLWLVERDFYLLRGQSSALHIVFKVRSLEVTGIYICWCLPFFFLNEQCNRADKNSSFPLRLFFLSPFPLGSFCSCGYSGLARTVS